MKLYGQCTDSGGGGTLHALARELKNLGMLAEVYHIIFCILHDIQTALQNAVELVWGSGGTDKYGEYFQTALQMLHGAYNLQNWHELDELKKCTNTYNTLT